MCDPVVVKKRLPNLCNKVFGAFLFFALVVPVFSASPAYSEHGDIIINNYSDREGMRPVIFSHWFHRIRFRCRVCHSEVGFIMEAGGNKITMAKIIKGEYCGACHNGDIAWGVQNCDVCHSAIKGTKTGVRGSHRTKGPGKW
ncbi:hypothetical protein MNBD_NITROSPINAE01-748 [hydrothermal vent metagenome]|uniref:Cytochrome c7-like domain-containing protein n=1 Tax=hydrothermal vent metagenome TaxID=652676 RepID=A0A3B1BH90_9ZZZZ